MLTRPGTACREIAVLILLGAGIALAETGAGKAPVQPREVAAAYLAAIEARDLDAAGVLFAHESTIFETGGVEGTWRHYRDHHLGPEVDGIATFTIDSRKDPEVTASRDETLALEPADAMGDHMVLQRNKPVPIWGTADPGGRVSVGT